MLTGLSRRNCRRWVVCLVVGAMGTSGLSGCSRQFWRKQAQRDTYSAVTEKLNNPHWALPRINLTPDPRSRFFDPFDPDREPLPPDDPAAHEYMHCVNGRLGYKNWHKLGTAMSIENPQWLEPFGIAVQNADPVIGHSKVQLLRVTLPQAVELAYIHNREYQFALEGLYLAALDLTFQRYALGVRYLGVGGTEPGTDVSTVTNRNSQTAGTVASNFGVRQLLPTGGQIAVELANEIFFVFGSNNTVSASALSYSVTQPLLFAAGRKIALEPLTQAERDVLYAARLLARFRQTLFTDIAQDYLGILLQRQRILNLENNIRQVTVQLNAQQAQDSRIFGLLRAELEKLPDGLQIPPELAGKLSFGDGFLRWNGVMSLEEQTLLENLSNDESFQAASEQIVGFARNEATPLAQAELRTRLNTTQNQYEDAKRQLADQLDAFKISLGLPPNIELEIDTELLAPFELISNDLITTEAAFRDLDVRLGKSVLPESEEVTAEAIVQLKQYLSELSDLRDRLYESGLTAVQADFEEIRTVLDVTSEDPLATQFGLRYFSSEEERNRVVTDVESDLRFYRISERDFAIQSSLVDMLIDLLSEDDPNALMQKLDTNQSGRIDPAELPELWPDLPRAATKQAEGDGTDDAIDEGMTLQGLVNSVRRGAKILKDRLNRNAQSLQVLQAGLRADAVPLNTFTIEGIEGPPDIEEVVRMGLEARHDLMNARARVMDRRRAVEIAANALEAGLDLRFTGKKAFDTANKNTTNYRAGVKFTTPLDQIDERNNYNEALIAYQRARREYMLLEDQIKQQIRLSWRQIFVRREQVEIDRQTIRNVARQYDNASLTAARGTQTNALSLLNALTTVLNAQNSLASDCVIYENNRLNIFRDMGIMLLDPSGMWIDEFYQNMEGEPAQGQPAAAPAAEVAPEPATDPSVPAPPDPT